MTGTKKKRKQTAMKKKDLEILDTQLNIGASLSSSVNMKTEEKIQSALSLHNALKNLKKKSISNLENEGNGFISPTDAERDILKKAKKQMGRAKKQDEHRKEVISFRVSSFEQNVLISWAKKHGFTSWKDCALTQAIEEENRDSKHRIL